MVHQIWQSALLSKIPWLAHGTSTKDFGSLRYPNVGETEDPCAENRAAFVESLGLDAGKLFLSGNEHWNWVEFGGRNAFFPNLVPPPFQGGVRGGSRVPSCDGLLTNESDIALAIKHADCLPLFFVDPATRTVAISHAGWKGVASGIAIETARAFLERGTRPEDLLVAIGPSIGPCHYSVHDERRDEILARTPSVSLDDFTRLLEPGTWSIDLRAIVTRQLVSSGVLSANVDASAPCTACHPDLYFSYHLTRGMEQMLSVISIKPL